LKSGFFSQSTNLLLCKTFLENGLRDPVSGEFGKAIVFAVSQSHAAKLVQIFNEMADRIYPDKYQSDFAVQVTSNVADAQQFAINFANNKLLGAGNFLPAYLTSKARICVTVGMMTTGYDCEDILNLGLFRPIFSPTDFIQIKGRGTRKHCFTENLHDAAIKTGIENPDKTAFKLFDFFANCEFFEEKFNYDEVLKLPAPQIGPEAPIGVPQPPGVRGSYEYTQQDVLSNLKVQEISAEGMRVDRMFFYRFEETVRSNTEIANAVESGQWDQVIDYVSAQVFDKPDDYFSLEKLRNASGVDRRVSLREILEKVFGLIPRFKKKDELLEEEFAKFVADYKPEEFDAIPAIKTYFKAYVSSPSVRSVIESQEYTDLATNPFFNSRDFIAVPEKYRKLIPDYVRDYVSLGKFAP
jgi:type I restriction enzyme, R subunit